MRKIYLMIFLLLVSFTIVDARLGNYEPGDCVNVRIIINATSANISTISYPNDTYAVTNQPMTQFGQTFNYTFCDTDTEGVYVYDIYDSTGLTYVNDFRISLYGFELTTGLSLIYLASLGILILFVLSLVFIINKIPSENVRDDENKVIQISWLKYARVPLWGLVYLSSWAIIYLGGLLGVAYIEGFAGDLLFSLSLISGWLILPMLIIYVFIIIQNVLFDMDLRKKINLGLEEDAF